jgi:hypothetical protein
MINSSATIILQGIRQTRLSKDGHKFIISACFLGLGALATSQARIIQRTSSEHIVNQRTISRDKSGWGTGKLAKNTPDQNYEILLDSSYFRFSNQGEAKNKIQNI